VTREGERHLFVRATSRSAHRGQRRHAKAGIAGTSPGPARIPGPRSHPGSRSRPRSRSRSRALLARQRPVDSGAARQGARASPAVARGGRQDRDKDARGGSRCECRSVYVLFTYCPQDGAFPLVGDLSPGFLGGELRCGLTRRFRRSTLRYRSCYYTRASAYCRLFTGMAAKADSTAIPRWLATVDAGKIRRDSIGRSRNVPGEGPQARVLGCRRPRSP
jgi:hypothetical protein